MSLRVTIEYLPGGFEHHKQTLAVVSIENESGLADVSNYVVRLDGDRVATVDRHRRADGFWPLVERAMLEIQLRVERLRERGK